MRALEPAEVEQLIAVTDYRDFLRRVFEWRRRCNPRFGYASLARRAGFSARSFPRDVMLGKKRLTFESTQRFAQALGLTGDLRHYFIALVSLEEGWSLGASQPDGRIERLRKRLRSKIEEERQAPRDGFYRYRHWIELYSAMGTGEKGATLEEIARRASLPVSVCAPILEQMLAEKVARLSPAGDRYLPGQAHLIFKELGRDRYFKSWYLASLREAREQAERNFHSDSSLFFNSVFSVDRSRLAELREELRELMLRFVDTAENPGGDRLAKLSVALFGR